MTLGSGQVTEKPSPQPSLSRIGSGPAMQRLCVFDINETLLDLAALDPFFAAVFGDPGERHLWFRTVLHTSLALTVTGHYRPFATIIDETLLARAAACRVTIGPEQAEALKDALRRLPLHADVKPALRTLKAAGYRIAALTNSGAEAARAQLAQAGIAEMMEAVMSTDAVQAAKPAPQPYLFAAKQMDVAPGDLWMVAGHAWDTDGARRAGFKSALVRRPGHGLNACFSSPDVQGDDLGTTVEALIAQDRPIVARMIHPGGR